MSTMALNSSQHSRLSVGAIVWLVGMVGAGGHSVRLIGVFSLLPGH